jgi:hypothetical protein
MQSRMHSKTFRGAVAATLAAATVLATAMLATPARAHHSFAPYNMETVKVVTGVVTRVNPDANHLQIFFAIMNDERKNVLRDKDNKPILWAVEMGGSAQSAQEGVSVNGFPAGTIFSVALHPLRNGGSAGARVQGSPLFKCPEKKPPAPGKHCDSVEGNTLIGRGTLPAPKG